MSASPPPRNRSLGVLARRPALPLVLLFIAGILLHQSIPAQPQTILLTIAVTAVASALTIHRRYLSPLMLCAAILLCGIAIAAREQFQYPVNHIGLFSADEPHLAQVELRLIDEPQIVTPT